MVARAHPKRRIMKEFIIRELSAVDHPAQEHARVAIMKRDFSADERQRLADAGEALPDGSYPIPDKGALRRAIQSIGRAKNPDAVRRHITRRARALGATDILPDGWSVAKKYKSVSELPESVRGSLPSAAQHQFMAVVNSALTGGASDESAFRQAWGALKNSGWHKDDAGRWVKKDYGGSEPGYPAAVAGEVQAVDFDTVLAEHEANEAAAEVQEDLREKWCALQRAFSTIAADESVSAADKITRMQESMQQYIDSLAEQSSDIAESMTKALTAVPAVAELLVKDGNEGDDPMTDAEKKQLAELTKTVADLQKQIAAATDKEPAKKAADLQKALDEATAKSEALAKQAADAEAAKAEALAKAGMSDDEKAYMAKMPAADHPAFMAMSADERKKKMSKAAEADPVVYKSKSTGEEFRKSDDPRLVRMAKQADEDREFAKSEREARITSDLQKRAGEDPIAKFAGEVDEKVEILRAIDKMDEAPRKALLKMLDAGGKAIEAAFEKIGHKNGEIAKTGAAFEKKVADIMVRDKVSKSVAMTKARQEDPDAFQAYQDAGRPAN